MRRLGQAITWLRDRVDLVVALEAGGGRVPGFEPHQPVRRGTGVSSVVRLTCILATDVCCDVQEYAHRL